ncbi:MAG: phenylalanine--tRNA ligase subunit beta, partial [Anaplasmataceae bacterium]|nr:phenylalanine--tRNA ligase subunit beta [Anaplasmataceae bacterium]
MKLSLNWLKQYINLTESNIEIIKNKLDEIGFEIENIETTISNNKKFVIAKIISIKSHPNAEKLSLCQVWDGVESREIVCGAGNVRPDLITVLAKEGAIIPKNGMEIKKNKIRGISSCGMLCSEEELNLPITNSDGIIDLDELEYKDKIGSCFYEGEDDEDTIFDVNITPNRGDVLSVMGIGRELITAGFADKLNSLPNVSIPDNSNNIKINKDICPFYGYIVIKNIDNNIELPKYIVKSLEAIGQKSISPVVDIVNYMMFTYGQPMHAFDLDKLGDIDISVDYIDNDEEEILALDDNTYILKQDDIVVKNKNKIVALAGIIGGKNTACDSDTKNILLEGAVFNNANIAMTSRRLKLSTESSYRFERLVDNSIIYDILHHTAETITNLCSGDISNTSASGDILQNKKIIDLKIGFISKYLGINLSDDEVLNILMKSYYECEKQDDNLTIKVPYWRNDIENKENIIADILRVYGIHNITIYPARTDNFLPTIEIDWQSKSRQILSYRGYNEVISWSFMSHEKNIKKNTS